MELHSAVERNNYEEVEELLKGQIQVNYEDNNWYCGTPLMKACFDDNIGIVSLLLEDGRVQVNKQDSQGSSALHIACQNAHMDIVELLMKNANVDVLLCNYASAVPFHLACRTGHFYLVEMMMRDRRIDVNGSMEDGATPLYICCEFGHWDLVNLLLEDKRVDVNKQMNEGQTALWIACHYGYLNIVKEFFKSKRVLNFNASWIGNNKNAAEEAKHKGHKAVSNLLSQYMLSNKNHFQRFFESQCLLGRVEIRHQNLRDQVALMGSHFNLHRIKYLG